MSPETMGDLVNRDAPVLAENATIQSALPVLLFSTLPALPVVDDKQHFKGIFGEREFITALFPGYVGSLKHASFVPKSIDAALEKRQSCRSEPVSKHMNTEHIDVAPDFSDVGLAEIFLHHRVLIVPVVENKRVVGVVTRADFFATLARRFLGDSV